MGNMRILVFSAAFGAGHIKAAEALIESIKSQQPKAEVHHLDFGKFVNKRVNVIAQNIYIEMMKHTPKLWGRVYYQSDKISHDSLIQRFLNSLGRENIVDYLNSFQPDLIICTYHVVAGILAQLRQEHALSTPVATVVTDYTLHSQWVHPGIDMYFVACAAVKRGLVERNIPEESIFITGIPVSKKFELPVDKSALQKKFGLQPDRLTLLVMCGAFGVLDGVKRICHFLADWEYPVQAIVVCGKNTRLYRSLEEVSQQGKNPIVRMGYSNQVDSLMAVADVILTKAGGLTVTEALARKLPLVIFKPIPGQEEENALFLEKNGAGLIAHNEEELEETVRNLLMNPGLIEKLRAAAANVLPGHGAERAVNRMLEFCRSNEKFDVRL